LFNIISQKFCVAFSKYETALLYYYVLFLYSMFLRLKYQFLRGLANRRLDDLLLLLTSSVKEYFG
jgi:hypothetical protein